MQPIGVFSGIASGIDFRELVDQIIALERRPIDRLQQKIDDTNAKQSAFDQFRSLLDDVRTTATSLADGSAFDAVLATAAGTTSGGAQLFSAVADAGTAPGSYQVEVLSLATAAKLGGDQFVDGSTSLNLSGQFLVNGQTIAVTTGDSLTSIRDKINALNAGANATGVSASILSIGTASHRLILTSDRPGSAGIDLRDTGDNLLSQLGFVDGSTSIARATSAGGESGRFSSETTTVASLLGLTTAVGSQNVTIGGQSVAIDLDNQSLTDIATTLNGLSGITASVQSNTLTNGTTEYYLDVRGTTSFVDSGHALELLGIVKQGRGAVAQQITGAVLASDASGTPATAATALTSVFQGGLATGIQVGDTFTITGTRGDNTAVSLTYTVSAGDTVQDFLNALNSTGNGFGGGARPATASIDANGQIVLTDSQIGDSQLSLNIVSHNEGGGTMDFGTFGITTLGRQRQINTGQDATIRVDGITLTRDSNAIDDAIAGVTLNLLNAEAGRIGQVNVERSADEATGTAKQFVDQYNALVGFLKEQLVVAEDQPLPPLFGDATLRTTRSSIVDNILSAVLGAATDLSTLNTVGIEFNSDGTLKFDATKFDSTYRTRFVDVQRLFTERGSAADPELDFISGAGTAAAGTYAVNITTAATQATLLGSGFSGIYADDATADTLTVTDILSGSAVSVQLANGMTTQDIVNTLNTQFALTPTQQLLQSVTLFSDATATTPVTATTTFDSIFDSAGASAGVTANDTIDYSGIRPDGTNFSGSFVIDDPTTRTVADFIAAVQATIGNDAVVSIVNGQLTIDDVDAGPSSLAVTLTANNEGGGSLNLGTMNVAVTGRTAMGITASAVGNEIQLAHHSFGSTPGFDVALTAGGADGTAQLGLAAGPVHGVDVAGTIGGFAATGSGQQLIGNAGTPVDGLHVSYTGSTARAAGDVILTVGAAAGIERLLDRMFQTGSGVLDSRDTTYADRIARLSTNIERSESRIARREAFLLKKFTAMEVVLSKLQAQGDSLFNQIQSFAPPSSSRK